MTVMQFIAGLPALLAITAFVIYLLLRRAGGGDPVTLAIIAKLRKVEPERFAGAMGQLRPAALLEVLKSDQEIQKHLSNEDTKLLERALRQQHSRAILVYWITGVAFLVGVALYVGASFLPAPLEISNISFNDPNSKEPGFLLDLDPVEVKWSSSGDPGDIRVSLENMDTMQQCCEKTTGSAQGSVRFEPVEFHGLLSNRAFHEENRVRAIIQSGRRPFNSSDQMIGVGATIVAIRYQDDQTLRIAAMIDDSAIQNYSFEAKVLIWGRKTGEQPQLLTYGGHISPGDPPLKLDKRVAFDLQTAKVFYEGPDASRLIRTALLGF